MRYFTIITYIAQLKTLTLGKKEKYIFRVYIVTRDFTKYLKQIINKLEHVNHVS